MKDAVKRLMVARLDDGNFRWTASDSSVISVNRKGKIRGKKPGASATLIATNRSNRNDKVMITLKVLRNGTDDLLPRPAATATISETYSANPTAI